MSEKKQTYKDYRAERDAMPSEPSHGDDCGCSNCGEAERQAGIDERSSVPFTDEQLKTYAGLRFSLGYEQTGAADWSDTCILMAREVIEARQEMNDVKAIAASLHETVSQRVEEHKLLRKLLGHKVLAARDAPYTIETYERDGKTLAVPVCSKCGNYRVMASHSIPPHQWVCFCKGKEVQAL